MLRSLPPLQIGQHTAYYPIIQGAMALRVSSVNLAGAIAHAGGVDLIVRIMAKILDPWHSTQTWQFFHR
jgi:nitronate monooxygenase